MSRDTDAFKLNQQAVRVSCGKVQASVIVYSLSLSSCRYKPRQYTSHKIYLSVLKAVETRMFKAHCRKSCNIMLSASLVLSFRMQREKLFFQQIADEIFHGLVETPCFGEHFFL